MEFSTRNWGVEAEIGCWASGGNHAEEGTAMPGRECWGQRWTTTPFSGCGGRAQGWRSRETYVHWQGLVWGHLHLCQGPDL